MPTYVDDYTALTDGNSRWNGASTTGTPVVVTYSFLEGSDVPTTEELPPIEPDKENFYQPMTTAQQNAVSEIIPAYSAESGIQFVEVDDPFDSDILFLLNKGTGDISWSYLPTSEQGSSALTAVVITVPFFDVNHDNATAWQVGGVYHTVIMHEIGHAVGLDHPHEGTLLDPSLDNHNHTIMSYDWSWEDPDGTGYVARPDLGPLDIDAVQYLYGDQTFADLGWTTEWDGETDILTLTAQGQNDTLIGSKANTHIFANEGDDTLYGQEGSDTLNGGAGDDDMYGGAGDDTYIISSSADRVFEIFDGGEDTIVSSMSTTLTNNIEHLNLIGNAEISGTGNSFGNKVTGNNANNSLHGEAGNDTLNGGGGNDKLFGGSGHDVLRGGEGINRYVGGAGNDTYIGGNSRDFMIAGAGSDHYNGGAGFDTVSMSDNGTRAVVDLSTGTGAGSMAGDTFENIEKINGTGYNDDLTGGAEDNAFFGARGSDELSGNGGNDFLVGAAGNDTIYGNTGNDRLNGGAGNDDMYGGAGNDAMVAAIGRDLFDGGDGFDTVAMDKLTSGATVWLETGKGAGSMGKSTFVSIEQLNGTKFNDVFHGDANKNTLSGAGGADKLYGKGGNDFIVGGAGNDKLFGEAGNDRLSGGTGSDILSGGNGRDVFVFKSGDGDDVITDYDAFTDDLVLKNTSGTVSADGDDMLISYGNGDAVTLQDVYSGVTFESDEWWDITNAVSESIA